MNIKSENQYISETEKVISFISKNCHKNLGFSDVLKASGIGANNLKKYFRMKTGCSPMKYHKLLRIERAKNLIKEGSYSFTEISQILGYESIHYFSRQFKAISGISPTEYKQAIKYTEE